MACLKAIFGTFAPQSLNMSAYRLLHILLLSLVLKASTSRLVTEDSINADSGKDNEDNANLFTSFNSSRRILSDCQTTGNPIDDCWRCDSNWQSNRKRLADCAIGFGQNAIGGKNGEIYVVTDPTDDDAVNPKVGTLRYGVIQSVPLWITFARDMNIQLTQELIMNSYKTIDGRGSNIHIANGPCITLQYVSHIIIHGIHIHDCKPGGNANVRSSPTHYGWRGVSDGDGISLFGATNVWIDHCTLAKCTDGLIDAIRQSTAITISNNYFSNHDKVMLLGHSDQYPKDKIMQVTIAYNHFGEGLIERIPRCRFGNFHVVNNDYSQWGMYAVGGSSNPTINVEGNRFLAPEKVSSKQVTKREHTNQATWKNWNWRSEGNLFLNGAYFVPSGSDSGAVYSKASSPSLSAKPAAYVEYLTANAGVISCSAGSRKWSQLLLLMLSTFKLPVSASNSTPTSPERVCHSHLDL